MEKHPQSSSASQDRFEPLRRVLLALAQRRLLKELEESLQPRVRFERRLAGWVLSPPIR